MRLVDILLKRIQMVIIRVQSMGVQAVQNPYQACQGRSGLARFKPQGLAFAIHIKPVDRLGIP